MTDEANTTDGLGAEPVRPSLLIAELWYAEAPDLADLELIEALRTLHPDVHGQDGSITVPHGAVTQTAEGARPPLLTAVLTGSEVGTQGKTLPDVSQTWDWPEAEVAIASARTSVIVTEMFAVGADREERMDAFGKVMAILVERTRPAAISWNQSQRVSDPDLFTGSVVEGVLNVRLFSVDGSDGEMVMDTLGLQVFGLPDLQCHFRGISPSEVAETLFSTGSYVLEHGDVIDDGHTISGRSGEERYTCQHELSMLPPTRMVIDVDLGEPYAAGTRNR